MIYLFEISSINLQVKHEPKSDLQAWIKPMWFMFRCRQRQKHPNIWEKQKGETKPAQFLEQIELNIRWKFHEKGSFVTYLKKGKRTRKEGEDRIKGHFWHHRVKTEQKHKTTSETETETETETTPAFCCFQSQVSLYEKKKT